MSNIKKIKKTAFTLFVIVSLILLWSTINAVRVFAFETMQWTPISTATTIIGALIVLAILAVALVLLYSIKKAETPFNAKNVTRLKIIAYLLVLVEPYLFISQWIINKFFPIVLNDNMIVTVHNSQGGYILAAGLTVYCISLVFEYGISLQKQADETL